MSRSPLDSPESTEASVAPTVPDTDTRTPSSSAELYLGYSFRDPSLLRTAMTHSSLAHQHTAVGEARALDNEQLEFLGDAVLSLTTAEILLREFPTAEEGDLTRLRASIVSREHLAGVARRLQLGGFLRLGRGEDRSGGRRKPALLADALEAVLAAIYLDGGLAPVADFVRRQIVDPALPALQQTLAQGAMVGDYKTALQERLQAAGQQPRYLLLEETGPDHQRRFRIAVAVETPDGATSTLAEAEGTTKKQAQQRAAQLALNRLDPAFVARLSPASTARSDSPSLPAPRPQRPAPRPERP